MRKLFITLIAGAVGALVVSSTAQAVPAFSVEQTGTGLTSVTINTTSTATFDVILSFGAGDGLTGYAVSLTWDGGAVAFLDGVTVLSTPPAAFTIPIAIGAPVQSAANSAGTVSSYAASSIFAAPPAATYTIGTIKVHGAAVGSTSITPTFVGGDGAATAGGGFICSTAGGGAGCTFASATVNIPEPATAALLGFGLLGLVAAGRRTRRH